MIPWPLFQGLNLLRIEPNSEEITWFCDRSFRGWKLDLRKLHDSVTNVSGTKSSQNWIDFRRNYIILWQGLQRLDLLRIPPNSISESYMIPWPMFQELNLFKIERNYWISIYILTLLFVTVCLHHAFVIIHSPILEARTRGVWFFFKQRFSSIILKAGKVTYFRDHLRVSFRVISNHHIFWLSPSWPKS